MPMMVLVYDRLVRLTPDSEVAPQLATSYKFSNDGLDLTFQLRDDVTFHDGQHFDANAVVANLRRAKAPESTVAAQLAGVTDMFADGPYQVRLHLQAPDPTILLRLATTTGAMISPAALNSPNLQQTPAGSGPFMMQQFATDRVILAKNPNYWDHDLVVPDRVELIAVADDAARVNLLTSGGADIVSVTPATWMQAKDIGSTGQYQLHVYGDSMQQVMFLNAATPPLNNPRVRLALNLAIDRAAISAALEGACPPNSEALPAAYPGYVDGLNYDYNVDEAKRILAEEGVGRFTLDTLASNLEPPRTIAQMVQGMLAKVGVTLNLIPTEPALVRSVFGQGKYGAMVHQQSITYPDPSVLFATHIGAGQLNPGNAAAALVPAADAARALELGSPQRSAAYQDLTRRLFKEPTHIPICNQTVALLMRSNMVGVDRLPFSQLSTSVDIRGVGLTK
ncbi:ABC transporter substrate-binding protein [Nocardia pseudovaccinii]|uniref:ABC transporter substrate-binding protein n=1 Tax=Nocardia pseudovaccinii TaxID=189540 RepID=UPI0007A42697|nr:ABC transporter substrate-binding protein [Nocardia pseudovaccinii]